MMWIKIFPVLFLFIVLNTSMAIADDSPVTIGVSLGLTGKYSKMCDMEKKAYLLWEEDINRRGGLLGKKVRMIIEDDQSNSDTARKIYNRFIKKDKLDFVIGPYSSGITAAIMPIAEEYGYPVLAAGAASDSLWKKDYKYIFGIYIPASRYAVGFLEMAAMNGINNFAIVYADDPFSINIGEGANSWGKKFGLNIVLYEKFKKGTQDLSGLAEKVQAANPDAIIVCGHYNESVDMLTAFKKIGWSPSNYFATVGPAMDVFYEKVGKDAEKVFSSSQWEPDIMFQVTDHEKFLLPFKAKYKITPSYHAAEAFAACQIFEIAVLKAGTMNRKSVRDVLSSMYAMSILGRYGVDKHGMQVKHYPLTIQWQKGKRVVVWPESVAKVKPEF